jgi:hypothetical protein
MKKKITTILILALLMSRNVKLNQRLATSR